MRTFVDPRGVTHEALSTYHWVGILSLCGQLRNPTKVEDKTINTLRAYASPAAPENVDCMSCLVNRARLDAMIACGEMNPMMPMVQIDLRITSWR